MRHLGTLGRYVTDVGIDDKWMKATAAAIQPGTTALFVLVRRVTGCKVPSKALEGEGGTRPEDITRSYEEGSGPPGGVTECRPAVTCPEGSSFV